MVTIQPASHRQIGIEAGDWIVRLSEAQDSPGLQAEFEAWKATSAVHAKVWDETLRAYEIIGALGPGEAASAPPAAPLRRHGPVGSSSRSGRWRTVGHFCKRRRIGIAATAAAVLAFVFGPMIALRVQADTITAAGEQRSVRLADGSLVRLAPESAIAARFDGDARAVRLLKGEAWFDVRHDPKRPFTVDAQGVRTTVLGTAFDVKIAEEGTSVGVERGRVRVDRTNAEPVVSAPLLPGDWVRIARDGARLRGTMATADVGAAVRGEVVAYKRPVRDVVAALRPWHSGAILITGDRIAARTVTGIYDAHDPHGALVAIARTHGGAVRRVTPWLLVLSDS